MEQKGEGNTIDYFVNTTFNYPTMAEASRVAALNGLKSAYFKLQAPAGNKRTFLHG